MGSEEIVDIAADNKGTLLRETEGVRWQDSANLT